MRSDSHAQRHADDLRDAVSWFKDEPLSMSSVERLLDRVENIADRIAPARLVALVGQYGYSRRVDLIEQDSANDWRLC